MSTIYWQLDKPMSAIAFDCDGTLSTIEGIDELAKYNGTQEHVKALTEKAMAETGITPAIYKERLDLVTPNRQAIIDLGNEYYRNCVADVEDVIAIFLRLRKSIYIISAGILPAVLQLARRLKISPDHVFAVDVHFNSDGRFVNYDETSPLIHNKGKAIIIEQIKKIHKDILYVGDGLNDLIVLNAVKRFVGYGGSFYRENIAEQCQFYIKTASMTPLLPLALTKDEYKNLLPDEKQAYAKGYQSLLHGDVKLN